MANQAVPRARPRSPNQEPAPGPPPRPTVYVIHEHWNCTEELCEGERCHYDGSSQIVGIFDNLQAANEFAAQHVKGLVQSTKAIQQPSPPPAGLAGGQGQNGTERAAAGGFLAGVLAKIAESWPTEDDDSIEKLRKRHNLYAGKFRYVEPTMVKADGGMKFVVGWEGETEVTVEKWDVQSCAEDAETYWAVGGLFG